jgi:hypothetical protein
MGPPVTTTATPEGAGTGICFQSRPTVGGGEDVGAPLLDHTAQQNARVGKLRSLTSPSPSRLAKSIARDQEPPAPPI